MFHWEFDMLELRIKELWDVVDYFCVTESEVDHRGNPRELALTNNLDKFDWAKEKLIVNVSKDLLGAQNTWDREKHQRFESLAHVLKRFDSDIKEDDLFLISDTDEIFSSKAVSSIIGKPGAFTFQMHM
jgi:beta-1,4-mannosyl-glycoprotein beta-1,4-N-acetylglucosaminyltransferase